MPKSLFLFILCWALCAFPAQASKIEFWQTQRKGANCFNQQPSLQWFKAAKSLGLGWVRLAYDKWSGQEQDFLLGNADHFSHLQADDLNQLKDVLDMAHTTGIKVVITPLSLPGARWRQNNNNQADLRLWQDKHYWQEAASFWRELAHELKDHPAVVAYNVLNEPTPEMGTGLAEQSTVAQYQKWYAQYAHSSHDLPEFYQSIIQAIRTEDQTTPIMLDAGWYAQANAFSYWPIFNDPKLLYAFHMYEPYAFSNHANFKSAHPYQYPGLIPLDKTVMQWDAEALKHYFEPFLNWVHSHKIPSHQIVAAEFGCYRRNPGCERYLSDLIGFWNQQSFHWAFYSFREDEWDGYDYEVGSGPLPESYWQALDRGERPEPPRQMNLLFEIIWREFQSD